ncbi:MAG: BlaI/MecI/CopY family transcriptional regulator [Phycisphaerales bacterium]|nr:MAG: BlaI/MecI/CopY family transcriptional regulator [Phycisphaerales bacterium]
MKEKSRELSENEWVIIQTVWELEPCAAPTVQEALQRTKNWAYTTVKTMMDRMVKKGLLKTKKLRNIYLYSAAITKSEARRGEIMKTLRRAFDGAVTPMMQFLVENDQISDKEYVELDRLIQSSRRRRKRKKAKK